MRKNENTESKERQARGSHRTMLMSAAGVCLSLTLLSSSALAETCTASPDCKTLGYTETSCPDGGVKCPWGNYWFCGAKKDVCQSCYVGWILNSDMTCSAQKASGKTPIGVVSQQTITTVGAAIKCQGVAVALNDLEIMNWSNANSQSSSYSASGVTGWHLPTMGELLTVYHNISSVQGGLTKAGGTQFNSSYYWSSSYGYALADGGKSYWFFSPVSGKGGNYMNALNDAHVRPVLAF